MHRQPVRHKNRAKGRFGSWAVLEAGDMIWVDSRKAGELAPATTHWRFSVFERQSGYLAAKGVFPPRCALFCSTQHVLPPEAPTALTSVLQAWGYTPFSGHPGGKGLPEPAQVFFSHRVRVVHVLDDEESALKSQPFLDWPPLVNYTCDHIDVQPVAGLKPYGRGQSIRPGEPTPPQAAGNAFVSRFNQGEVSLVSCIHCIRKR